MPDRPPVASGDLSFEEMSNQRVVTVESIRWSGLFLRTAHVAVPENLAFIPALAEDTLVIGLRGNVRARVRLSKVYEDALGPGSLLIHPRERPGIYDLRGVCDVLMLHMDAGFLGNVGLEVMDMDPARAEVSEQFGLRDGLIAEIGAALLNLQNLDDTYSNLYAESLINALALHTLRRYGMFPAKSDRLSGGLSPTALRLVKDYIYQHPGTDLKLADLSKLANLSVCYFSTLFKASTGQSVHQYVLEQRIVEAKRLLLKGNLTLAEIADAVGFADQSHFTRAFKRIVGTTPGAIRKHRKYWGQNNK